MFCKEKQKSCLSHRIIDSFLRILKRKIKRSIPILLPPRGRRPRVTKPVLTQQIIIGFKARLEKKLTKIREYSKFVKLKVFIQTNEIKI